MEKNLAVFELYGIYGELLTDNQRDAMESYFGMDLSLAEIADIKGVSRQAVKDMLDKAEQLLYRYEKALGCYGKIKRIQSTKCDDSADEFKKKVLSILCDKPL